MSFLKRLLGLESNADRNYRRAVETVREMRSPAGARRRTREEQEAERAIQAALNDLSVQKLMMGIGLTEEHIRDVYRRVMMDGNPHNAAKAVRNAELLHWFFFNGGMNPDMNQMIGLSLFAKKGYL